MAFARFRVLAIRLFAVRPSADIQRVVEDAGAACGIAGQRVRRPGRGLAERMSAGFAATRGRYAVGIEAPRDGDGRQAGRIVLEDPDHHRGLGGHDLLQAADAFAIAVVLDALLIAVRRTTGVLSHRVTTHQRIAGLVAGGAQLLGVDRTDHADVQRRDYAFLARRQDYAAKVEKVEQRRDIGLTARQPVHGVGVDDVDAACGNGRQQRLHTGAVHRSRRLRCVCEAQHLMPARTRDLTPTHHQLRLDRLHVLFVRRIPRIYRTPLHLSSIRASCIRKEGRHDGRLPDFRATCFFGDVCCRASRRARSSARSWSGEGGCDGIHAIWGARRHSDSDLPTWLPGRIAKAGIGRSVAAHIGGKRTYSRKRTGL
ncbi:hypothetical protein [Sphingomonas sp. PvP018]|uniref:hypothetical protein n=1 Tax=Sphingomonas sp. PvP018 TaxID=2817852 RepID=UPI001FD9C901|nr:hypothetical protein [Sphingomonas sp. PvP018]